MLSFSVSVDKKIKLAGRDDDTQVCVFEMYVFPSVLPLDSIESKFFTFFILFACLLCFGHSSGLCLNFFSLLDKLAASLNREAVGQQFQCGQCEPLDSSTSPMLLLNFMLFVYSSLVVSQFTYTNQSVSADKNKKKAITICCGHISLFCSMANLIYHCKLLFAECNQKKNLSV